MQWSKVSRKKTPFHWDHRPEKEQNQVHQKFISTPLWVNSSLWLCICKRWGGKFSTSPKAKTLLADRTKADEATRQRRLFCPVLTSTCTDLQYASNDPYLCIMRVIILYFKLTTPSFAGQNAAQGCIMLWGLKDNCVNYLQLNIPLCNYFSSNSILLHHRNIVLARVW